MLQNTVLLFTIKTCFSIQYGQNNLRAACADENNNIENQTKIVHEFGDTSCIKIGQEITYIHTIQQHTRESSFNRKTGSRI